MQLYPAIDIKDGKCVRLTKGEFNNIKTYSDSPADMAKHWQSQGAGFLHIVDLDGALAGKPVNLDAVRAIRKAVDIPLQLGGGIRDEENVALLSKIGIDRCIIGTRAVREPSFMERLVNRFSAEAVAAGIDARDGFAAAAGWGETSEISAEELAMKMKAAGIRHIIYTDISRDGMLGGPNITATKRLTKLTELDIIASGGVSSEDDILKLKEAGIHGAIIGKALYEGKIDLKTALKIAEV